eukprot:COSAG02_NODE_387_length_23294_cov_52.630610_5_plen_89_part_00
MTVARVIAKLTIGEITDVTRPTTFMGDDRDIDLYHWFSERFYVRATLGIARRSPQRGDHADPVVTGTEGYSFGHLQQLIARGAQFRSQ